MSNRYIVKTIPLSVSQACLVIYKCSFEIQEFLFSLSILALKLNSLQSRNLKINLEDFPGCPLTKTLSFQCKGWSGAMGSIPGQGTTTPYAMWPKKKKAKQVTKQKKFPDDQRNFIAALNADL